MTVLRSDRGHELPFEPRRWHQAPTAAEQLLLEHMTAPVLDVGCGPGRMVAALATRGLPALGVDPAPSAVTLTRRRGGMALQRSVFDTLPGEGRWGTVLLLDGNIGIGGDPVRLLTRCAGLAAATGSVIVEMEPPGTGWTRHHARLERDGMTGPWFDWAVVGTDAIEEVAEDAGMRVAAIVGADTEGRWWATLRHAARSVDAVA